MKEQKVFEATLTELRDHPILDGFPMLTEDQFSALVESIETHGVLKPLTIIEKDGKQYVIDGRNRRSAALKAGLKKVPVVEAADGTDPLSYAIESAVTGRNLTKSGIALMLYMKHPDLVGAGGAKPGRQRNGHSMAISSDAQNQEDNSFRKIAERYHVHRDYFRLLIHVRELCRPWPKNADFEWDLVKQWILEDELSITRLLPSLEGFQKAHPVGREGVPMEAPGKAPVNLGRGFDRSITYLLNQFERWEELPKAERNVIAKRWWEMIAKVPEDLKPKGM
jgi:hypothetical protein